MLSHVLGWEGAKNSGFSWLLLQRRDPLPLVLDKITWIATGKKAPHLVILFATFSLPSHLPVRIPQKSAWPGAIGRGPWPGSACHIYQQLAIFFDLDVRIFFVNSYYNIVTSIHLLFVTFDILFVVIIYVCIISWYMICVLYHHLERAYLFEQIRTVQKAMQYYWLRVPCVIFYL
jgi:hypothetical protein